MRHIKLYFTKKCSSTEKQELQNTIPTVEESEPKRHKGRKLRIRKCLVKIVKVVQTV